MLKVVLLAIVFPAASALPAQVSSSEVPPSLSIPAWQKAAGGKMSFEVVSIRLAKPGTFRPSNMDLSIEDTSVPPRGRLFADAALESYIEFAYKIIPSREQEEAMIAGLPKWVGTDRFVIQAEATGNPTKDQMRLMMQSLLADRFHLQVHVEGRTEPVLGLVLAKRATLGSRIRPHSSGLACDARWMMPPDRTAPTVPPGGFIPECNVVQAINGPDHAVLLGGRDIAFDHIADYLGELGILGRPVIDETGLTGRFDFTLQWTLQHKRTPDEGSVASLDSTGVSLIEALREQFGMKLRSTKVPLRILVIDHVEPPSPN